jgi:type I restriction enzyme M protein
VWFYDVDADGRSLDDKRTPLLPEEKLGSNPRQALAPDEHAKNNLPDVLARWRAGTIAPSVSVTIRVPRKASACPRNTTISRGRESALDAVTASAAA